MTLRSPLTIKSKKRLKSAKLEAPRSTPSSPGTIAKAIQHAGEGRTAATGRSEHTAVTRALSTLREDSARRNTVKAVRPLRHYPSNQLRSLNQSSEAETERSSVNSGRRV